MNNIPIDKLSDKGIAVFNTPGANANSVKELVLGGMLLASRNLAEAWHYTRNLNGNAKEIEQLVEAGKKQFAGRELLNKTIGIIGLGAIGRSVANICIELGMNVIGYDPNLTVEGAWQLSALVKRAHDTKAVFRNSDYITCHVPMTEQTKNMIDDSALSQMPKDAVLLNFARKGIVDDEAVRRALEKQQISAYVTDFLNEILVGVKGVIALPHLGASTSEAEENCALMVAEQIKNYLEHGNIVNSVNLPPVTLARGTSCRLSIINRNEPNMVGQISTCLASENVNIHDMINQSRDELAYTLVDTDCDIPAVCLKRIASIEGVLQARMI